MNCTCAPRGSPHPKRCAVHPYSYGLNVAEINLYNLCVCWAKDHRVNTEASEEAEEAIADFERMLYEKFKHEQKEIVE